MYEVYLEQTAERELKRLSVQNFHRIIPQIKTLAENPRPSGCHKIFGKAIGASELETIGLFMKLTRKQRLSRLCELDIDEKLIDEKNEIYHGKILKKVKEVIFKKLGKARIFGDYNSFKEKIRKR